MLQDIYDDDKSVDQMQTLGWFNFFHITNEKLFILIGTNSFVMVPKSFQTLKKWR